MFEKVTWPPLFPVGITFVLPKPAPGARPPPRHRHLLLKLCIDGQHLRMADEGKGHDGDGVRRLGRHRDQVRAGHPTLRGPTVSTLACRDLGVECEVAWGAEGFGLGLSLQ